MLHIFAGAPVIRDEDIALQHEREKTFLWKSYNYTTNDLLKRNGTSTDECSLDICYEYNATQFSNVINHTPIVNKDSSANEVTEDVIQCDDSSQCLQNERTTADDLYEEIYAENHSLLSRCESVECSGHDSLEVYPDCDSYFEEASQNLFPTGNKPIHCNGFHNKLDVKLEVKHSLEDIAVIHPELTELKETTTGCTCQFNLNITEINNTKNTKNNTCYDANIDLVKLTPLALSPSSQHHPHNVCVVILQILPLKNVFIKQGVNIGNSIKVASMMVGDESMFYCNITLWGDAACWVERLVVGDVVIISALSLKLSKNNKICGRTNKYSTIYNLHSPKLPYSHHWKSIICMQKLHSFVTWIHSKHKYVNSNAVRKTSRLVVRDFTQLSAEAVNTVEARIINICVYESKSDHYNFFYHKLPKVVVEIQDESSISRNLYLWGEQYNWLETVKANINKMVVISDLMLGFDYKTDIYTLHTTTKATIKYIHYEQENLVKTFSRIACFNFGLGNEQKIYLSSTNLLHGLGSLDGMLYQGCVICHGHLSKDSNGVLGGCCGCRNSTIGYCFRKFAMGIENLGNNGENCEDDNGNERFEFSDRLEVLVYPGDAAKLFPKLLLSKNSGSGSDPIEVFKNELNYYLSGRVFDLSLRKAATNDEPSSVVSKEVFFLVDLQEI